MKKLYSFVIAMFLTLAVNAQTTIDISTIDSKYTKTFDGALVIDDSTCASKLASPNLWYVNPFKGLSFTDAEISFDVYTYHPDSIKVLGSLLALYDVTLGRMYFSNGSYLGYNLNNDNWVDANLLNYGIDSSFIVPNTWKNIKLQFTASGFAMYVNNTTAFNESSTDVKITKGPGFTNYSDVISFMQNADSLVFGTGFMVE